MNENMVEPRWKVWEGLAAIIAIFVFMFGASFLGNVLVEKWNLNDITVIFTAALLQTVLLIGIPAYIIARYGHSPRDLGFISGGFAGAVSQGIKWGILLFIMVVVLGNLIQLIYPMEPDLQDFAKIILMVDTPGELFLTVIMGAVLAPIGEEIYFRGFLYPVLRSKVGVTWGIIFTSLFFALMHFDIFRFLPIAAGGAGLAYLYEKTGNIWANIIAHAVWNAVMIALIFAAYRVAA